MNAKPGRAVMALAYMDWVRRLEREDYRLGFTTVMPVENFGEPEWLRAERAKQKEAAK
jgi:hypothetical protein